MEGLIDLKHKDKIVKGKAAFEILLVLSMIFIFSMSNNTYAEEQELVCCSETEDENFCQYADKTECKPGSQIYNGRCENFDACKTGCCDLTNVPSLNGQDSKCYTNVAKADCNAKGGNFLSDSSCNYQQCNSGCCVVGGECALTTEAGCKSLTSQFPDLNLDFRNDVIIEFECSGVCAVNKNGCCVTQDENANNCNFASEQECNLKDGLFYEGRNCGEVPNGKCDDCKQKTNLGCVEGLNDVYWFDSCGNRGDIVKSTDVSAFNELSETLGEEINSFNGKCDLNKGFKCGEISENGVKHAGCVSLNCVDVWDNPRVDEDGSCGDRINDVKPNDPCFTDDKFDRNNPRKNGESWCEYDDNSGPGLDLPGTRHYRHYCENGVEKVDDCVGYRETICRQAEITFSDSSETMSYATCAPNRVINEVQDCSKCIDRECCQNIDKRDCLWVSSDKDTTNKLLKEAAERKNQIVNKYGKENVSVEIESDASLDKKGFCVPLVPPGNAFWQSEGNCDAVNANNVLKSVNVKFAGVHEWDCEYGCRALGINFLKSSNQICNSYGDCGAKYNLAGEWGKGGFKREINGFERLVKDDPGDVPEKDMNYFKKEEKYDLAATKNPDGKQCDSNGDDCTRALVEYAKNNEFLKDIKDFSRFKNYRGALNLGKIDSGSPRSDFGYVADIWTLHWFGNIAGKVIAGLGVVGGALALGVAIAIGAAFVLLTATIAAAALVVMSIVFYKFYGTRTANVEVKCGGWQAPSGGGNCNLCNEPGERKFFVNDENECLGEYNSETGECTEKIDLTANGKHSCNDYLCKSLGSGCDTLNTVEGVKCINICIPDNPENLQPAYIALEKEFEEKNKEMCRTNIDDNSELRQCETSVNSGIGFSNGGKIEINNYIKANSNFNLTFVTCNDKNCNEQAYADCKWDYERKPFDEMKDFIEGGYSFKHTVSFKAGIDLLSGSTNRIFVQCKNRCGFPDTPSYPDLEFEFKVATAPELGAPRIIEINPKNNGFIANSLLNINNTMEAAKLEITLNEIAECKYDNLNLDYERMKNSATCVITSDNEQKCFIPLLNLVEGNNKLFIKCKDEKGNSNQNSLPDDNGYNVIGTKGLVIDYMKCKNNYGEGCGEIFDNNFTLEVNTINGADNGNAKCGFGIGRVDVAFFETSDGEKKTSLHKQFIDRNSNNEFESIFCLDDAGNIANSTVKYKLVKDNEAPKISKIYSTDKMLVVETTEEAICKYSNDKIGKLIEYKNFDVTNEVVHSTSIDENNYFKVICKDIFENSQTAEVYLG